MPAQLVRDLQDIVGAQHALTDPDLTRRHVVDWTGRFVGHSAAVVKPASTAEVVAIVDTCRRHGVSLVPQGGNTGLVGGSVPLDGEVVLSLQRIDAISPVDTVAHQVTAGAGATIAAVQAAAARAGLRYAVDFAARDSATVGGTIATNAGGLNVLRYGGTRQQVLGLEAVLGTSAVVSRLGGLVKDNTGYHLPSLLCGSEGTLGVVTAARLRLVRSYPYRVTALIGFDSVAAAVAAVARCRASIDSIEAAELMLEDGVDLVCQTFGLAGPFHRRWPALILLDAAADEDPSEMLADVVGGARGLGDVAVATDTRNRQSLWRYREDHPLAITAVGVPHKFDVTVPLGAVSEFVEAVPSIVGELGPGTRTFQFGHVGDGNIHVNVVGLEGGPIERALRVETAIYDAVLRLDGSISAEHGIGTVKAPWLPFCRSASELEAMRSIKKALDPDGVLNPRALLGAGQAAGPR